MFAVTRCLLHKEVQQAYTSTIRRSFNTTSRMESSSTSASLYATISSTGPRGAEPEDTKELRHHLRNGKGFVNPWPSYKDFTPYKIVSQILLRKFRGQSNTPDTTPPTVPIVTPTFLPTRTTPKLRATWLGHACYFVEFPSGLRVLFDPVFEPRCSPFSFMGPKRYTPQPCQIEDIPIVDAVVISHSHYDHLSHPTVTKLAKTHPNAHFFVPLKLKEWFNKNGITKVTELDWWEECHLHLSPADNTSPSLNQPKSASTTSSTVSTTTSPPPKKADISATISCLPAQHVSARTPFNKGHTLWASWSITDHLSGKSVWFGGDTGYRNIPDERPSSDATSYHSKSVQELPYCPAFEQIGRLRGPFDLGLIPIGAYEPRSIMSAMHASPFDSVEIFRDTKCKRAMGIHWGTWVLTEEDVLEPPRLLKQALKARGIAEEGVFETCDIGESREFE